MSTFVEHVAYFLVSNDFILADAASVKYTNTHGILALERSAFLFLSACEREMKQPSVTIYLRVII